jgi:hypothetical protein
MREPGKDLAESLAGVLAGGNRNEVRLRMTEQEPDEFFTRITTCADNGYFDLFHTPLKSESPKRKTPPALNQRGENIELV